MLHVSYKFYFFSIIDTSLIFRVIIKLEISCRKDKVFPRINKLNFILFSQRNADKIKFDLTCHGFVQDLFHLIIIEQTAK